MMRDGFPAIEKEGDLVAGEDALDGLMVALQVSHQHGRLAITSPGPDVAQDFARRQPDLSVRVEAGGEAQGLLDGGCWILDTRCWTLGTRRSICWVRWADWVRVRVGLRPILFEMLQN